MNATLIICMFVAILGGFGSAVAAFLAGWGWISVVPAYGLGGSITLVVSTLLVSLPRRQRSGRRAPAYST